MATRYDAGCAIFNGEIFQRPHGADLQLRVRQAQGVHAVIEVKLLVALSRPDLDTRQASDPVIRAVGQQHRVSRGQYPGMLDQLRRSLRNGEDAADALGLVAIEVALIESSQVIERRPKIGIYSIDDLRRNLVKNYAGAVALEGSDNVQVSCVRLELFQWHVGIKRFEVGSLV